MGSSGYLATCAATEGRVESIRVGGHTCDDGRLGHRRVSIENIPPGDLITMTARDPMQRSQPSRQREVRLLLGIVAGGAGQCARIGRAPRGQLDRHIEQPRILGGGKPLALGAGRATT